jgi:RNA polymerase sigma factor (sigma-70 family)
VDHPELRSAIDRGYGDLLAHAIAMVHKRRSWLKASAKTQLAENIVQEALHRAWKNANRFDTTRRPLAWLMGFVTNVAAEEMRQERKAHVRATDLGDDAWDNALKQLVNPGDGTDQELKALLRNARQELSEGHQRILRLHYDEHLTGPALANRLGLASSGAARIAKHRALEALRTILYRLLDGRQENKS